MKLSEILHLVWINTLATKSKVLLTSLGIIVGSATIVLVIAIGHGGELDVAEQFKNLNAGAIEVSVSTQADMMDAMMGGMPGGNAPGGAGMPSGGGMPGGGSPPSGGGGMTRTSAKSASAGGGFGGFNRQSSSSVILTTQDVQDLEELVPGIAAVSLIADGTGAVIGGDLEEETDYTVVGALPEYQQISNLELLQGDFISDDDNEDKTKVAVIGSTVAKNIFGSSYVVGETLSIEGKTYDIIGVLSSMGTVSSGISPDEAIYLPYATAAKYVLGNNVEPKIAAVAEEVSQVETVMENIKTVLAENYPKGNFTLTDAGSKMEAATTSANTLSTLLIAVASIVFVVGGIGIMNVLFVSVKERTQEIGILKALGCSKREILLEFLSEANFISILGGVLGVGVGFALVPLVRLATGMTVSPLPIGGLLALVFAVVTGTVFGFYPAWKAAALMPIEALSQE